MKKVLISAGHTNVKGRDRGAVGNGYIEGELAVEFRGMLVKELEKYGVDVYKDLDNTTLTETIADFKLKTNSNTIAIDIHWNAATPAATGTEVLIPESNSATERSLAKDIADAISRILGIKLRGNYKGLAGVKTEAESHHKKLGFMRLSGETVLIEMCFISNASDMEKYQKNKKELVIEIGAIICNYAKGEVSGSTSPINTSNNVHIVVSGDNLSKLAQKYSTTVQNIKDMNNLKDNIIRIGQKLRIK